MIEEASDFIQNTYASGNFRFYLIYLRFPLNVWSITTPKKVFSKTLSKITSSILKSTWVVEWVLRFPNIMYCTVNGIKAKVNARMGYSWKKNLFLVLPEPENKSVCWVCTVISACSQVVRLSTHPTTAAIMESTMFGRKKKRVFSAAAILRMDKL